MNDQLFIPSKIKVGYRERDDTYTKKLAYVIYYDQKGKLRKEDSWRGWIDKKLGENDFDNKPHSGFTLNKDIQRSSEWFGDGHNMIRIYDDRGIEFEITTGNLIFILMTTDCLKRGLQGEFVYSWYGKELILLPTGCDEYKNSIDFTSLQAGKIGVKNLTPGCSYETKRQENLIYLGKFDWHVFTYPKRGSYSEGLVSSSSKMFIFVDSNGRFIPLNGLTSLAIQTTDVPVSNYADLIDKFNKSIYASKVVGLDDKEVSDLEFKPRKQYDWDRSIERKDGFYVKEANGTYLEYGIELEQKYVDNKHVDTGKYKLLKTYRTSFNEKIGLIHKDTDYSTREKIVTLEQLKELQYVTPFVVTENGRKHKLKTFIKEQRGY